ncbi:MAG: four helix bundle protein [Desulfobacterales bacterium]
MNSYKQLDIYQISFDLAIKVHEVSMTLPNYELFEEGSQVRRSSKRITASIVEGYGRKKYKADFIKYLIYAHASCDETIVHLHFIQKTHTAICDQIQEVIALYDTLGAKINRFIQYVETSWQ